MIKFGIKLNLYGIEMNSMKITKLRLKLKYSLLARCVRMFTMILDWK